MTTAWRLAREAEDRHTAPRGQGAMPLALRLNDLLGRNSAEVLKVVAAGTDEEEWFLEVEREDFRSS